MEFFSCLLYIFKGRCFQMLLVFLLHIFLPLSFCVDVSSCCTCLSFSVCLCGCCDWNERAVYRKKHHYSHNATNPGWVTSLYKNRHIDKPALNSRLAWIVGNARVTKWSLIWKTRDHHNLKRALHTPPLILLLWKIDTELSLLLQQNISSYESIESETHDVLFNLLSV